MGDFTQRLRERAAIARSEGTATALGDALHFDEAAGQIDALRAKVEALIEAGIGVIELDKRRGYQIPYAVRDPLFAALAKSTGSPDDP